MSAAMLQNYYRSTPDRGGKSIYELWEDRVPLGDSITPSGFCSEYVSHILALITDNLERGSRIVSLGSGNGFVESVLSDVGYELLCIDRNEEAVAITSRKGLPSLCADFYDLPAGVLRDTAMIYADGFFGHLYEETGGGLKRAVDHIGAMRPEGGTKILVSNDAPLKPGLDVEPHASVPDFWYLTPEFISAQFDRIGFESSHVGTFDYERPLSGIRTRAIYLGAGFERRGAGACAI